VALARRITHDEDCVTRARLAAAIWLLGATVYLVCEAIAATGSRGYSYAADYISDLGVHAVMNVGAFMVHGVLLLLGAVVVTRGEPAVGRVAGRGFVLAAAVNATGNVLVGAVPSGSEHGYWHVLGAGMAIIGGNVAVIVAGIGGDMMGATPAFRWASIGLGVAGIAWLAVLIIDGANGSRLLPAGLVERGAVYPIIAWELMAGVAILRRRGTG
jgi:hypothetical membrane protein